MPALAQETEEKDGSASSGSLPTVQVKASAMQATTGMELSMRQTPQSVTVVSKPVLREQGITGMAGAMRSTTGINVLSETGRVRFQSRGFYIDQIQVDGISSTVPGSSGNPARDPQSMSDLAVYDHIEVLRGPTGLPEPNWDSGANYWMKMAYSDKITSNALMLGTRLNPAERLENVNESARHAAFSPFAKMKKPHPGRWGFFISEGLLCSPPKQASIGQALAETGANTKGLKQRSAQFSLGHHAIDIGAKRSSLLRLASCQRLLLAPGPMIYSKKK